MKMLFQRVIIEASLAIVLCGSSIQSTPPPRRLSITQTTNDSSKTVNIYSPKRHDEVSPKSHETLSVLFIAIGEPMVLDTLDARHIYLIDSIEDDETKSGNFTVKYYCARIERDDTRTAFITATATGSVDGILVQPKILKNGRVHLEGIKCKSISFFLHQDETPEILHKYFSEEQPNNHFASTKHYSVIPNLHNGRISPPVPS